MNFKHLLYGIFFFSLGLLQAQEKRKSRLNIHQVDRHDQLQVLDSLLNATFNVDHQAFINYSQQYVQLALDLEDFNAAARGAMNAQHPITVYGGNPSRAIALIDEVMGHTEKIKDSFLKGGLYLKRGRAYAKINLVKAIDDYTAALHYFPSKDTLHRADVYLFRGQAHSNNGKFVVANEDFTKAYKLYQSQKQYPYMVYAQQGIINMYSMNGFYDKAKQEREELIKEMAALNIESYIASEYYNQALDYKKMGEKEKEYEMLLKAESFIEKDPENYYTIIGIHSMFVSYYCEQQQLDEAKKHLNYLEALNYDYNRDLPSEMNYLAGRIDYLQAIGEYDTALNLVYKKLELGKQLGYPDEVMSAHELLGDIHFKMNNLAESIKNVKISNQIKDSIYNKSTVNSLAYYQTLYEIERKERELIEKMSNIQLLEKDSESFKKGVVLSGLTIIFGFVLIILYRNQNDLKKHKRVQEVFSQKLLMSQERERKRISENLHDSLGQQLLVIKNRILSLKDDESKELIDAAIDEVRLISRDLHPFQLKEMGLTKAIENTINQIDKNFPIFLSTEIDNIDGLFSPEEELHLFRILQESLSNILKHSEAKAAKLSIRKFKDHISISIRDNGIGFDFNDQRKSTKSLGLRTLLERSKFLNGQMKVQSKKDSGTSIEFQIPLKK